MLRICIIADYFKSLRSYLFCKSMILISKNDDVSIKKQPSTKHLT